LDQPDPRILLSVKFLEPADGHAPVISRVYARHFFCPGTALASWLPALCLASSVTISIKRPLTTAISLLPRTGKGILFL
jgi:hypothetical protein